MNRWTIRSTVSVLGAFEMGFENRVVCLPANNPNGQSHASFKLVSHYVVQSVFKALCHCLRRGSFYHFCWCCSPQSPILHESKTWDIPANLWEMVLWATSLHLGFAAAWVCPFLATQTPTDSNPSTPDTPLDISSFEIRGMSQTWQGLRVFQKFWDWHWDWDWDWQTDTPAHGEYNLVW